MGCSIGFNGSGTRPQPAALLCAASHTHLASLANVVADASVALGVEAAWSDVCGMHSTELASLVAWIGKEPMHGLQLYGQE